MIPRTISSFWNRGRELPTLPPAQNFTTNGTNLLSITKFYINILDLSTINRSELFSELSNILTNNSIYIDVTRVKSPDQSAIYKVDSIDDSNLISGYIVIYVLYYVGTSPLSTMSDGTYQITFELGSVSTGSTGPQGNMGNTGAQGFQGNQGFQGLQGNQGFQGFVGGTGADGPQGFQGPQGSLNSPSFITYTGGTVSTTSTTLADVHSSASFLSVQPGFYEIQFRVTHDVNATTTGVGFTLRSSGGSIPYNAVVTNYSSGLGDASSIPGGFSTNAVVTSSRQTTGITAIIDAPNLDRHSDLQILDVQADLLCNQVQKHLSLSIVCC